MRRRLFTISSALSLVLCIATCVLWLYSYTAVSIINTSSVSVSGWYHRNIINSNQGRIFVGWCEIQDESESFRVNFYSRPLYRRPGLTWGIRDDTDSIGVTHQFLGFGFERELAEATFGEGDVWVPFWFIFAVTLATTIFLLRRWSRLRMRHASGRCPVCGYDLRATP